jgi:hypothetical protein
MSDPALDRALEPVSAALAADGYALSARRDGEAVAVRIAATPEACDDCLVPKELMARMITGALADAGLGASSVDLRYPNEP